MIGQRATQFYEGEMLKQSYLIDFLPELQEISYLLLTLFLPKFASPMRSKPIKIKQTGSENETILLLLISQGEVIIATGNIDINIGFIIFTPLSKIF
jgi:hypothetical protein